ncbi:myb protein-related [Anaeramoeba flamelloides]|uniref:Myb protein-related n=1 Tax=Anaeramoeba flamelloides TaxID=1746091 RepID=A0ABQ8YCI3_9EUKA|nr:myb protein-related [Anaeramoeba flamelloides]
MSLYDILYPYNIYKHINLFITLERWKNVLDPNIDRRPFTKEEKKLLFELHKINGNSWKTIAKSFSRRTENFIKNQWYCDQRKTERKKKKKKRNTKHLSKKNPNYNNKTKRIRKKKIKIIYPNRKRSYRSEISRKSTKIKLKKIKMNNNITGSSNSHLGIFTPISKKIKIEQFPREDVSTEKSLNNFINNKNIIPENIFQNTYYRNYPNQTLISHDQNQEMNFQTEISQLGDNITFYEDLQNCTFFESSILGVPLDLFHQICLSHENYEKDIDAQFQDFYNLTLN